MAYRLAKPLLALALLAAGSGAAAEGTCAAEDCSAEDASLLQVKGYEHSVKIQLHKQEPSVTDLSNSFDPNAACESGMDLQVESFTPAAGVSSTLDIANITSGGCSTQPNGVPKECCVGWGSNVTVSGQASIPPSLAGTGATMKLDIEFQTWLIFSWSTVGGKTVECPLCGANCSVGDISIAGLANFPVGDVPLPPCPEDGATTFEFGPSTFMLPTANPSPVYFKALVTVQVNSVRGEPIVTAKLAGELL